MEQFKELRNAPEIVVATPGRFIDMIKMKATNLKRASFCVLDEADRMFDLGFEPQVRSIVKSVRPDRQTLLFSATFPRKIEKLCEGKRSSRQIVFFFLNFSFRTPSLDILSNNVRINIGNVGEANTDITQVAVVLDVEAQKWPWVCINKQTKK